MLYLLATQTKLNNLMASLEGKVAFITGGTKGIGFGMALALLEEGCDVAITGRDLEKSRQAATILNQSGNYKGRVVGVVSDVRDYDSQLAAVEQVLAEFGKIDVVVANAGIGHFAPVYELSPKQWKDTIETNLTGAFYTLKASINALKQTKGYYMTVSSLAGTNFFANGAAYNASKFGLTGFTQAAMLDLRKFGIKTTTIMPGSVATYFNGHTPNDDDHWKIQIEDLGKIVVDLLKMPHRTLPSKIEIRPTIPPSAK